MMTRSSLKIALSGAVFALLFFLIPGWGKDPVTRPDPARFAPAIAIFDKEYEVSPNANDGGIVFTGSSSIRLWDLQKDFSDLPVLNRGFGGSIAHDLTTYADQVVLRYKPKIVVVYTGSNDLNAKLSTAQTLADYTEFLGLIHQRLPKTVVIVNSVKVSSSRVAQIGAVKELNEMLARWCEGKSWVRWLESMDYLMDEQGKPKDEFYRKDRLHLNDEGYARWKAILDPVLREEWAKATVSE